MKKIVFPFVLLPVVLMAQSNKQKEKIQYASSYQAGIIVGKAYTTYGVQMIQGIRYKNVQTGIGVALDPYGFRTVPLFGHFSYVMHPQKNSVYVYGDAGISIPWDNGSLPEKYDNSTHDDWHKLYAGFYAEGGAGYNILFNKKRNAVTINAGYSYKRFTYDENVYIWNGIGTVLQTDHYIFDYRRIVFRLGFSL
ncbi:MAG TPA: hypothetical protein VH396_14155 [Chitinophagaceae bacterium]|jgi:hypothetical protein